MSHIKKNKKKIALFNVFVWDKVVVYEAVGALALGTEPINLTTLFKHQSPFSSCEDKDKHEKLVERHMQDYFNTLKCQ